MSVQSHLPGKTLKVTFVVESMVKSQGELWKVADECAAALRAVASAIVPYKGGNDPLPECYRTIFKHKDPFTFVWLAEAALRNDPAPSARQTAATQIGFHERTLWIPLARAEHMEAAIFLIE